MPKVVGTNFGTRSKQTLHSIPHYALEWVFENDHDAATTYTKQSKNKTVKSLSVFDLKTLSVCSLNKDFDDETKLVLHTGKYCLRGAK